MNLLIIGLIITHTVIFTIYIVDDWISDYKHKKRLERIRSEWEDKYEL